MAIAEGPRLIAAKASIAIPQTDNIAPNHIVATMVLLPFTVANNSLIVSLIQRVLCDFLDAAGVACTVHEDDDEEGDHCQCDSHHHGIEACCLIH